MTLSIVITNLADVDLSNTICSIRDTAGSLPEIIVVNDGGFVALSEEASHDVTVIRNEHRVGVGPSRHIGLLHAAGQFVMVCDSHMRFSENWYEKVMARIKDRPKTLTCFACLGLDRDHMDVEHPKSVYYGATWNVFGQDPNDRHNTHVMEAVWNKSNPGDDAEIPCVMGGAYIAPREWFLKISGLNLLRQWGEDETILSLRSWMFGGEVRIMSSVGIGHKFMVAGERQPFTVEKGMSLHNKLLVFYTLMPDDVRNTLIAKLHLVRGGGELSTAKQLIAANHHLIEVEKAIVQRESSRDFNWVMERFNIPLPV